MPAQILSASQAELCLKRLALQVRERYYGLSRLNLVSVAPRGTVVAERLIADLQSSGIELLQGFYTHETLELGLIQPSSETPLLVVDDVLNTGRTLFGAVRRAGELPARGIQILVLVDRGHRQWPVAADFVGLRLATTLPEYIRVEVGEGSPPALTAWLDEAPH